MIFWVGLGLAIAVIVYSIYCRADMQQGDTIGSIIGVCVLFALFTIIIVGVNVLVGTSVYRDTTIPMKIATNDSQIRLSSSINGLGRINIDRIYIEDSNGPPHFVLREYYCRSPYWLGPISGPWIPDSVTISSPKNTVTGTVLEALQKSIKK